MLTPFFTAGDARGDLGINGAQDDAHTIASESCALELRQPGRISLTN